MSVNRSLASFLMADNSLEDSVTRAEVLFAKLVAEHHLSFLTANHFTHLTSKMLPDSKIASKFSSACTKTTSIVKGVRHPHFTEPVEMMNILARLWDERVGKPATRFFNMPVCNIANGLNRFRHID